MKITKEFFNTLSANECYHILALAQERIDETDGVLQRAVKEKEQQELEDKVREILGTECVNYALQYGETDVTVTAFGTVEMEAEIPLEVVMCGSEAIHEYMEDNFMHWERPSHADIDVLMDSDMYISMEKAGHSFKIDDHLEVRFG